MHQFRNLILVGVAVALFGSCATTKHRPAAAPVRQQAKSIVILYENDVHCGIDGYTHLAGLRDAIQRSDTAFVGVVFHGAEVHIV